MSGPAISKSGQRLATLKATAYLAAARAIVRATSLEGLRAKTGASRRPVVTGSDRNARFWAGRIQRAAMRLPGESKCLPQALALHWLLGREGIDSQIAIAIHKTERESDHAFHAWLECDGEVLVGHCDRDDYRVVLTLGADAQ